MDAATSAYSNNMTLQQYKDSGLYIRPFWMKLDPSFTNQIHNVLVGLVA